MKPRELFGVAVRCIGLYYITQGIWSILRVLDVVVPLVMAEYRLDSTQRVTIGTYLAVTVLYFAISAFFLKRGDWLVGIAYPPPRDTETITDDRVA